MLWLQRLSAVGVGLHVVRASVCCAANLGMMQWCRWHQRNTSSSCARAVVLPVCRPPTQPIIRTSAAHRWWCCAVLPAAHPAAVHPHLSSSQVWWCVAAWKCTVGVVRGCRRPARSTPTLHSHLLLGLLAAGREVARVQLVRGQHRVAHRTRLRARVPGHAQVTSYRLYVAGGVCLDFAGSSTRAPHAVGRTCRQACAVERTPIGLELNASRRVRGAVTT